MKKNTYSLCSNLYFMLKNLWDWNKKLFGAMVLRVPIMVLLPLLGVYLPKLILSEIETKAAVSHLLMVIGILTLLLITFTIIEKHTAAVIRWGSADYRMYYLNKLLFKMCDTDYECLEDVDFKDKYEKFKKDNMSEWGVVDKVIPSVQQFVSNFLGFTLFAAMLTKVSPLLILLIAITTCINSFFLNQLRLFEANLKDSAAKVDRHIGYILYKSTDFSMGKDIRLYGMDTWLMNIYHRCMEISINIRNKNLGQRIKCSIIDSSLVLLRDGVSYGYLIYLVLYKAMSASDFILYFGIITGLSGWLSKLLVNFHEITVASLAFSDMREFLNYPDKSNRGVGNPLPKEDNLPLTLEFINVSYCYSNSKTPTIKNFNLKVNPGEKLALIGINGAGKTTLMKLVCGFYSPTSGKILVNEKDIEDYNRDEYYKLISAVFQDVQFLPATIRENIAQGDFIAKNDTKIWRCLKLAGVEERIRTLPNGLDTLQEKGIFDTATDFSGGEAQKLLLARALYKDAPILILDEPTAALDPIAENEMYLKYAELTKGKTSFFISHRLSSTRFCDRIVFLEYGEIQEIGTHEELMDKGGKYAEMFKIQSQYYKEDVSVVGL
jgi:ABC-type multidrug transport system fused ATPase/permease subunit